MNLIVSSIPGRLRIRHNALRQAATLKSMEDHLRDHPAVREMRGNPRAGSLVVQYDARHTAPADMEKAVLERAWHDLEAAEPPSDAARAKGSQATPERRSNLPRRKGPRPLRMRVNRVAKVVMLVTLGVSLAVAELRPRGWKHWHATTGWAFVVALAVHLYVYRRHLVR